MAYIKFIKGTQAQYTSNASTYSSNGSIFFTTDTNLVYANGIKYGLSSENEALLKNSISAIGILSATSGDESLKLEITYTDGTKTHTTVTLPAVTDSRNGLMTPTQKGDLADIKEQVITGGSGTLKNQVAENKVSSSDKTIVVTSGSTAAGGAITGTDLSVNIDNSTIVKNANSGIISVDSSALVQYIGDKKAIEVSVPSDNNKIVSLKIKNNDQILSASTVNDAADGLSATIKIKPLNSTEIGALSDGANVKEAFKLVGIGDANITNSSVIKIYKDTSLLSVKLLHANLTVSPQLKPSYNESTNVWTDIASASQTEANRALCFAYKTVSGSIEVECIPVGEFLTETEFGKGIGWNNTSGQVEGVIDPTSESFLTVGADGFKLAGVQDAINTATTSAITNINVNGRSGTVTNHVSSTEIDAGDIKIDKDGTASNLINTGGTLTKGTNIEAAIIALEAQLIWYDASSN